MVRKYYKDNPEYAFKKCNSEEKLNRLRNIIPDDFDEPDKKVIMDEYKSTWKKAGDLTRGKESVFVLYATIIHCIRKYDWQDKFRGNPFKNLGLYYRKNNIGERTCRPQRAGNKAYSLLCNNLEEYKKVKKKHLERLFNQRRG